MSKTPRVAAIHDLSGFGRCSLTIVIPVLSAMGVQCCPLPTAYLSTHTGGFTGNTFLDMTDQLAAAMAHWKSLQLTFSAVYTGFMGNARQMELAADFIRYAREGRSLAVVDPVMGDHGRLYRTYTPEMCRAMAALAEEADLIVPNRTEAALLLELPYEEASALSPEDAVRQLSRGGQRSVVLTGVSTREGGTGAACYDRSDGTVSFVQRDFVGRAFHGTGDLFASVLTGALVRGGSLRAAAELAAEFVELCAAHTAPQDLPLREGIDFEPLLGQLARRARGGKGDKA